MIGCSQGHVCSFDLRLSNVSLLIFFLSLQSPQIAILDFGSQYSHLIARRVRELHLYCELYACTVPLTELSSENKKIQAIILSGGPASVYADDAPHVQADVWAWIEQQQLPVLGICYGMQEMAYTLDPTCVASGTTREFGRAQVTLRPRSPADDTHENIQLFLQDLPDTFSVWMSHGDKLQHVPPAPCVGLASTSTADHVIMADPTRNFYALQFHPEVSHSQPYGVTLLRNFCIHISKVEPTWVMQDYAEEFIASVRDRVGPTGHVLGAVSGGVDSTVAAVLLTRAIGDRFHAVLVDNGCLRKDEAKTVLQRMRDVCGVNLVCVEAQDRFLTKLKGVTDPEQKRKIIGNTFIDVFQEEATKIEAVAPCEFLLQGTLYPDVIESVSYKGPSATIKTHHNVGGLPEKMSLKLIEPLRELFKDEVRELGMALGIDEESVWRHPFPGPGLAIRVLGEVTPERVAMLQHADAIMLEELHAAGHYRAIGQAFVVLLPVQSVGVMGDGRTYENVAAVRCVETTDYMTADFYHLPYEVMGRMSSRIINEVRGINRLCYDISSKPPATIEWE